MARLIKRIARYTKHIALSYLYSINSKKSMEQSGILHNSQIEQLTPMWGATRDAYQSSKDLVLLSPTGSDKTLAFPLPLVQSLKADVQDVQAVVLVPPREFASQIEAIFRPMNAPFKPMSCYGGRPAMEKYHTIRGINSAVITGTPDHMNDHLRKRNLEVHSVTILVIDEFDKCLEFGFHDEMAEVIGQLPALWRRVLLSTTDAEEIPRFVEVGGAVSGSDAPSLQVIRLDLLSEEVVFNRLDLQKVISPEKSKLETLYRLLCTSGDRSTLVFMDYRGNVERVATYLKSKKFPCNALHDGMEQEDRERVLYKLRNGSYPALVPTDLAVRGLGIPGIDNIAHYHVPISEEAFTHHNEHTAYWEACGSSFLPLHAEEQLPDYLPEEISVFGLPERTPKPVRSRWTTLYVGKSKKDKLNKVNIVGLLYKKGESAREDVGQVDVEEHYALVAARRSKAKQLFTLLRGRRTKGMKTLIGKARQTDVIGYDGECY